MTLNLSVYLKKLIDNSILNPNIFLLSDIRSNINNENFPSDIDIYKNN